MFLDGKVSDKSLILGNLYYDVDKFLEPIKEVRIEYASTKLPL